MKIKNLGPPGYNQEEQTLKRNDKYGIGIEKEELRKRSKNKK